MSNHSAAIKQLLTELSRDVKGYQQLSAKLKQQHQLLANRDSRTLPALNDELNALMGDLYRHAQQRTQVLEKMGLSPDDSGMQRLFKALPATLGQQGQQLWQQLFQLTQECQELNNQNGRLLARHKQMIDKLLKPEQQYCYGPGI
ncbi:hypothetical protein ABT56_08290 [Photobacterium aquae]|uniref:Flagellar biosynthesis protein FlgN n=1 Tax=Photobacterium aquae TaxID=1195763 RepID=A0A0J1H4A2_9GAMM|nr:flagellar protein FlgN [Photobacterium aquae]KLV06613.1 hypothetical protein ABT56_08290 [Photobacterium aquae]